MKCWAFVSAAIVVVFISGCKAGVESIGDSDINSVGFGNKVLLLKPYGGALVQNANAVAQALDPNIKYEFVICNLSSSKKVNSGSCRNPFTKDSKDFVVGFMKPTTLNEFRNSAKNAGFWYGVLNWMNGVLGIAATGGTVWAVYGATSGSGAIVGTAIGGPVGTVAGAATGMIVGATVSTAAGVAVSSSMGWMKANTTEKWEKANTKIDQYFNDIFLLDGGLKIKNVSSVMDIGYIARGLANNFGAQIKPEFKDLMNGDRNEFYVESGFPGMSPTMVQSWVHNSRIELEKINASSCNIPFATSYDSIVGSLGADQKLKAEIEALLAKTGGAYIAEKRPTAKDAGKKAIGTLSGVVNGLAPLAESATMGVELVAKNATLLRSGLNAAKQGLAYSPQLSAMLTTLQSKLGDAAAVNLAGKFFPAIITLRDKLDEIAGLVSMTANAGPKPAAAIDSAISTLDKVEKILPAARTVAPMVQTAFQIAGAALSGYNTSLLTCDAMNALLLGLDYREQTILNKQPGVSADAKAKLAVRYCELSRRVNKGKTPEGIDCP